MNHKNSIDAHSRNEIPKRSCVWIDADSCPREVRRVLIKAAKRINSKSPSHIPIQNKQFLDFIFVAASPIPIRDDKEHGIFCQIIAPGPDMVDKHIYQNCMSNHIVITRDIVFAHQLYQKDESLSVLNDRGEQFTKENINARKLERDLKLEMIDNNLQRKNPKKTIYSNKDLHRFAACLERCLHQQQKLLQ